MLACDSNTLEPKVGALCREEFKQLSEKLIKFLNDNFHPHTHIIITPTGAELSEGLVAINTMEYVKD